MINKKKPYLRSDGSLLWYLFAKNRPVLAVLLFSAALLTTFELSIPWFLQIVVDLALGDQADAKLLNYYGMAMLAVLLCLYLCQHFFIRVETRLVYETASNLRQLVYQHIVVQPLSYFSRKKNGELLHRLNSDTGIYQTNLKYLVSQVPYELMNIVAVLVLMAFLDPGLTAVVAVFLLLTSWMSAKVGRPLPVLERRVQIVGARLSSRIQELIAGIRTVKSFGQEQEELHRLDQTNSHIAKTQKSTGKVESYLLPVFDLMELMGVVLVVWYGAHLMLKGELSPGGLVAFIAYMEILAAPVSRLGKYYADFLQFRGVSRGIRSFLADGDSGYKPQGAPRGSIPDSSMPVLFRQVNFSYPHTGKKALDNINLLVQQDELIALVGRNGSGKSTLMDLLQCLRTPDSGRIFAGGVDLCDWDEEAWRSQIGVMSQDVFLFNATVLENICYGCSTVEADRLEQALEFSGLGKLIAQLPKGLNTIVGEGGRRLSGGQRQSIALARLFLRDPCVVIYDEPTAALDRQATEEIAQGIKLFAKGRISFVIAHDRDLIRMCHQVVLLDEGRLLARGGHDHLLATEPLYRHLLEDMDSIHYRRSA